MKLPQLALLIAGATLVGLAACSKPAPAHAPAVRSFQEVMQNEIDLQADGFWAASGVVEDGAGDHSLTPKTDAEWQAIRQSLLILIAGTDKLATPGRPLTSPGGHIADEGQESVASPDWIRTALVQQRPLLIQRAGALKAVAQEALVAVDHRDLKAIDEIGERLDQACEACHASFWYPRPADYVPPVLPANPTPAFPGAR